MPDRTIDVPVYWLDPGPGAGRCPPPRAELQVAIRLADEALRRLDEAVLLALTGAADGKLMREVGLPGLPAEVIAALARGELDRRRFAAERQRWRWTIGITVLIGIGGWLTALVTG